MPISTKMMQICRELTQAASRLSQTTAEFDFAKEEKINQVILDRQYFTNAQGWTSIGGGIGQFVVPIIGAATGNDTIAKTGEFASRLVGQGTNAANTFLQGKDNPLGYKQQMHVQNSSSREESKRRITEAPKEIRQAAKEAAQAERSAYQSVAQATR